MIKSGRASSMTANVINARTNHGTQSKQILKVTKAENTVEPRCGFVSDRYTCFNT